MGTPQGAVWVRTSIVHRYGTVERFVEPHRVLSCQIRVPTNLSEPDMTRQAPMRLDGSLDLTRQDLTDRSTVQH